ncbi:MAG: GspH/FimT family pseudopilin [Gammaproteobacteria bacterium]|nr:GspH/FimT family pseudopilin [Gammaproteobacteria bacterium]
MDIPRQVWRHSLPYLLARGFTLIELMVTLTIAAILVTLSTSFGNLLQRNELTTVVNTLVADMNFARSEAIKTGTEVIICITQDGLNCAKGDRWHDGWMVYYDKDGDRRRDDDEPLTRQQSALSGTTSIIYNGRPVDNYVRFQASGTTNYNGTFAICNSRNTALKRALVLSNTGRLRSSSYLPNGKAINCPD